MRARIAGHPLHPALVHFPVGLWLAAVLWDGVGWWRAGETLWWQMGYWCIALGLAVALPALATGLLEFFALASDDPAINTATAHMMAMVLATTFFGASWVLRAKVGTAVPPGAWTLGLDSVGAIALGVGGWLGGTLVYRYGIGRESRVGSPGG